jgi:alpha-galactosidase
LYGDWEIDRDKFPNGLKPVFDYIKSLGMKPGLWLTLATADLSSAPAREHPEWFIKDKNGELANLHAPHLKTSLTACMTTDWYEYIKNTILRLVSEHGLGYVKLDFAIATSAYVFDDSQTGCYAEDHPLHRDREESFAAIYDRCMELFDDLHEQAPELFIDCTFETAGKLHLVDYGVVKHAEGDWLANVEQPAPLGTLRVRNLAWERTPAIPATSLVIGNLNMNDERHELAFKSLTGTLPIMLGDPRELSADQRRNLKKWADWYKGLEERHGIMSFRQDLPGYGEPVEGSWDGFCRVNTDTGSGGLVGVFKQGSKENTRTVTVPWLAPATVYDVKRGATGGLIATMSGKELAEKGFPVRIDGEYDGELFEIVAK